MEGHGESSAEDHAGARCGDSIEVNSHIQRLPFFKAYKRRWFVLLVLCLLNCSNSTIWLTFAPVTNQSAHYLDATVAQINWLSMVYMVVAIPLSFGTTWMLDTLGLRITLILGSWLNMLGALLRFVGSLRYLGFPSTYAIVMVGQTVGGLAQPLIFFTPTKLAALWFPDHQRAMANMVASMSNPMGVLLTGIISPMVVKQYNQVSFLLLTYAIPASITCLLATVGIRNSVPPTPPSASAESSGSEPFLIGIKLILRNRPYLVLLLCFGAGIGIISCFLTLLEQVLCVKGYNNDFAGLCSVLFIASGIVGAGLLGLYVDKTKKFIEAVKVNLSLTALACIAFSLVCQVPAQSVAVAAVCSLFGFFSFSTYPVAMELSVECSYPVGEATSAGLIFISGQIQSVLYIILLQGLAKPLTDFPLSACGGEVLNWRVSVLMMAGLCSVFTCIFVVFFNTRYRRLEAEEQATYGITHVIGNSNTTTVNEHT